MSPNKRTTKTSTHNRQKPSTWHLNSKPRALEGRWQLPFHQNCLFFRTPEWGQKSTQQPADAARPPSARAALHSQDSSRTNILRQDFATFRFTNINAPTTVSSRALATKLRTESCRRLLFTSFPPLRRRLRKGVGAKSAETFRTLDAIERHTAIAMTPSVHLQQTCRHVRPTPPLRLLKCIARTLQGILERPRSAQPIFGPVCGPCSWALLSRPGFSSQQLQPRKQRICSQPCMRRSVNDRPQS